MATIEEHMIPDGFKHLILDLSNDLYTAFPEHMNSFNAVDCNVFHFATTRDTCCPKRMLAEYQHCCDTYRQHFFDILYENETLFGGDNALFFLSGVDFNELWKTPDLTQQTRTTLWKYIQLILFKVVEQTDHSSDFGNSEAFFEAIDDEALKVKMTETLDDIKRVFENMGGDAECDTTDETPTTATPPRFTENMPDTEKLHEHLSGLFKGKIGTLANEIMEETRDEWETEFGIDFDNEESTSQDAQTINDVFSKLLKDPLKLVNLIKKIGSKLEEKIKNGDVKESELLEETAEMMKNLKNTPGLKDMEKLFKSFSANNGGKSSDPTSQGISNMLSMMGGKNPDKKMKTMQRELDKNIKSSKQRERMLRKLEENRKNKNVNS